MIFLHICSIIWMAAALIAFHDWLPLEFFLMGSHLAVAAPLVTLNHCQILWHARLSKYYFSSYESFTHAHALLCTLFLPHTHTHTHLWKLLDCSVWPPGRCQVPGMGALWLARLFNGLPDSPFPLWVEDNPGECSKLITFGPGLAATFQCEAPR